MGFFDAIADIAGGLFGKDAAEKQADATKEAALIAAEAARSSTQTQFKPYNAYSPIGAVVIPEEGVIRTALTPMADALSNMYRREAKSSIDENAARYFDAAQAIAQPGEDRARLDAQSMLFRSGRLGTHSGDRAIGEVERALANARLTRELAALEFGAQQRQQAFGNYTLLNQLPAANLGPLSTSRNPETIASQGSGIAAQGILNAAYSRQAANNAFATGIQGAFKNLASSTGLDSWFDNQISSIFTSNSPAPRVYEDMGGYMGPPQEFMGPPRSAMGGWV